MFGNDFYQKTFFQADRHSENIHSRRYHTAVSLFKSAVLRGQLSRLWRRLLRQPRWLSDLASFKSHFRLQGSSYAGIKVVDVNKIVGTEGQSADFDIGFYPVSEEACECWVNMALAFLSCCTPLPPVELIQIEDTYFVRDGHHRISVARAFGQAAIDAEVILWKAQPPFSWKAEQRKVMAREDFQLSTASRQNPSGECCA